jgi:hypothetical protein
MRAITLTLIITIGIALTNCSNSTQTKSILKHTILKNEVNDIPIKTQVQLDVLITDTAITKQKVSDLLTFLYDKTAKRTGFKYHTNPTNIYIYAYTSKEKAESGMAQWIGMISKSYDDVQPKIDISDTQLNSLTLKPVEKFGLSEDIRLEIWNKSIKVEDRAQKEADMKYPLDKAGITQDDIKKNGALNDKLKAKYEKELAAEYGISVAIIDSIGLEGMTKGWPFPKY